MLRALRPPGCLHAPALRGLLAPVASALAGIAGASAPARAIPWRGTSALGADRRGFASKVLVVDGAKSVDTVLAEVSGVVGQDDLEILAVGQKGVMSTLPVLARLEQPGGLRPTFTVLRTSPEEAQDHAPRADFYVRGANNYRFVLPGVGRWERQDAREKRIVDARLLVSNKTEVTPLAKAIAARSKMMSLGRSLVVETSLAGLEAPTRLRVSRLLHAVARAYGWQVAPQDASRPTRNFRCSVTMAEDDLAPSGDASPALLKVEVIPDGPVGGTVPVSA